jgi:hypothetical protein
VRGCARASWGWQPPRLVTGAVCIANIGASQRRRRFWPGVASLALGLGHGIAVVGWSLTPWLLLPAAVLLFGGFAGVLQSREKT